MCLVSLILGAILGIIVMCIARICKDDEKR